MFLTIFTLVHVVSSLIGIGSGLVVMYGLLARKRLNGWTVIFLATTIATSLTGFGFPFHGFTPAHAVGILSLFVLTLAVTGRYRYQLAGSWRWIYVITATLSLYLNVFVLVVQAFQKIPALKAIAPTQSEPPFALTQLVVLTIFVLLGVLAVLRFRIEPGRLAAKPVER
jgi:hypothetical protein